jgi:hypothetical protein
MASQHKVMAEWNPDYFIQQARLISADVELYISHVLLKNNIQNKPIDRATVSFRLLEELDISD